MVTMILLAGVGQRRLQNPMMNVNTQRLRDKLRHDTFVGAVELAGLENRIFTIEGKFKVYIQKYHPFMPLFSLGKVQL